MRKIRLGGLIAPLPPPPLGRLCPTGKNLCTPLYTLYILMPRDRILQITTYYEESGGLQIFGDKYPVAKECMQVKKYKYK